MTTSQIEDLERNIVSDDDEEGINLFLSRELARKKAIDMKVHAGQQKAIAKMLKLSNAKKNPLAFTKFNIGDSVLLLKSIP